MLGMFDGVRGQVEGLFNQVKGLWFSNQQAFGPQTANVSNFGVNNHTAGYIANRYRTNTDYGMSTEGAWKGAERTMIQKFTRAKWAGELGALGLMAGIGTYLGMGPVALPAAWIGGRTALKFLAPTAAGVAGRVGSAIPGMLGRGAIRSVAGTAGLLNGVMHTGIAAERVARTVLTGNPLNIIGLFGAQGRRTHLEQAVDAYLPNFRNLPNHDIRRYAPNPTIVKRVIAGRAVGAVFSGLSELINPRAPDSTIFYDGVNIRRKNDMGAHAGYGQQLMSSSMGIDKQVIMRSLTHLV